MSMNEREQLAKDNGMTIEFVNWFFDNKKDGCGNVWFMMMAAMWEGWSGREAKCAALAADNAALNSFGDKLAEMHNELNGEGTGIQGRAEVACQQVALEAAMEEFDAIKTPATDAFLDEVRAQAADDFCKMLGSYAKVEPECFNPQFADLYAKIVNRIFSEVMDNPEVYDLGTMSDWLERESEESRAYADMSINHHAKLRQEAAQ